MTEDLPQDLLPPDQPRITSLPLTSRGIAACWGFTVILLSSGIVGTFYEKSGAPCATLIALGALLLVLALMKRIPLRLEVAGTKIDASYPPDQAYNAGRAGGVVEGLEAAIKTIETSQTTNSEVDQLLRQLRRTRDLELPPREIPEPGFQDIDLVDEATHLPGDVGYRGPTACNAAGISYRQLDYWARTGLVEPSVRGTTGSGTQRLYSFEDVLLLVLIKRLLDAGVSLQQIRTAILDLRENPSSRWTDITLMSDGQSVYETTRDDELLALMGSGRAMFGISLATLAKELRPVLGELPAEPVQ